MVNYDKQVKIRMKSKTYKLLSKVAKRLGWDLSKLIRWCINGMTEDTIKKTVEIIKTMEDWDR